jgi:hypothetical protein
MAVVAIFSQCVACKRPFFYHPHKVPSIRIDGQREPICETCVARANVKRIANGLPPIEILPGAYEACDAEF